MVSHGRKRRSLILSAVFTAMLVAQPAALAQKLPQPDAGRSAGTTLPEKVTLPPTDEEIDKSVAQLESRLADLRRSGAAAGGTGADGGSLLVAAPEERRKYERLTSELLITLDKHIQVLQELKVLRRTYHDHTAEMKAWKGFTEKPPFPISFLDDLRDALLAQKLGKQTFEVRLAIVRGDLQQYTKNLKESQKELRLIEERLGNSRGDAGEPRLLWLRDFAHLQNSLNEAGAASSETQRLVLEDALLHRNEYIRFLEQKLGVAEKVSPLSKAEFEQKLQELDGLRKALEEELQQVLKEDAAARGSLKQARDAADRSAAEFRPGVKRAAGDMRADQLQSALEARQAKVEATAEKVTAVKAMLQMADVSRSLWEDRYALTRSSDIELFKEQSQRAQRVLSRLKLWNEFIQSRFANWVTLIQRQRDKLDKGDRTEAERNRDLLILKTYEERQTMLMRATEAAAGVERLANRLNEELLARKEQAPVKNILKELLSNVCSFARRIWKTELYVAEETVIAEGNKIVKPIAVTIGKVIQALMILVVGTWLARRLIRPVRWIVTTRFKKGENVAQQVGKITSLVLFLVVLAFSLISVNIPLAVFAFFGGALAIGLGFGAQNIINNFISSLILLFDRSIKVGDIVEIDGQGGRVISIGLRSSHIMGFDGVELLVPNSQFLQQKVTNWTLSVTRRRYSISVGVAYGSPTKAVSELIRQAVENHGLVLKDPPPVVLFENFADSALTFSVYFWLELVPTIDNRVTLSEIRHHIVKLFDEAGIVIAFPQRDVHLESARPLEVKVVRDEGSKELEK